MMTTHIILASCFILNFILLIVITTKYDKGYIILPWLVIILGCITISHGMRYRYKIHYRELHEPTIKDVNSGYATIIECKQIKNSDTVMYYDIEWLGTNQTGEREINN